MKFSRVWAMPNGNTFSIRPIKELLQRYISETMVVADPFARDSKWGTMTNDLNPNTSAKYHLKAEEFVKVLLPNSCDIVLFDPPYSPRQISELYQSIGLRCSMKDTQDGRMKRLVKEGLTAALKPNGISISFGWNSVGFGKKLGFEHLEIVLVCHGGVHNDTIVVVERKIP